jgi:transcriptional regulator with PAS, ATPase and Fis domain
VLNELKKSRKLAGKILSGKAIYTFDKIIGNNEKFLKTIDYAKKIADSRSTVLITGESGTGKEIFAQSIHNSSIRRDEAFIAVNCGAIPRTLIESELFGYEEGAFTGAKKGGNAGMFELADEGTIFLDEISELPISLQTTLLRVIQEKTIRPIGSDRIIPIDVRLIVATNKDLSKMVSENKFRQDLYYRLNVLNINIPPLRERKEDIPLLINEICKNNNRKINLSDEAIDFLKNYNCPGNIRELQNFINRLLIL